MTESERVKKITVILKKLPNRLPREPRLSSLGKWKEDFEVTYGKLINEWIPNQPDSDELMTLFILLDFNPTLFVAAIFGKFRETAELMGMK